MDQGRAIAGQAGDAVDAGGLDGLEQVHGSAPLEDRGALLADRRERLLVVLAVEGDQLVRRRRVEGDVQGRNITVGATGTVVGKIIADEAMISGAVNGEIRARAVVLTRTSKIASDITQESLSVEAGAVVEGTIRRPGSSGNTAKSANGGTHKAAELLLTTPAEGNAKPKA